MTNSELTARKIYSVRLMSNRARRSHRHAMNDFLIRRANCGQDTAQLGTRRVAVAGDEVVRAEPHAAFHGHRLAVLESNHCASTRPGL